MSVMKPCPKNNIEHEEILFSGEECPVCKCLEVLEDIRETLVQMKEENDSELRRENNN